MNNGYLTRLMLSPRDDTHWGAILGDLRFTNISRLNLQTCDFQTEILKGFINFLRTSTENLKDRTSVSKNLSAPVTLFAWWTNTMAHRASSGVLNSCQTFSKASLQSGTYQTLYWTSKPNWVGWKKPAIFDLFMGHLKKNQIYNYKMGSLTVWSFGSAHPQTMTMSRGTQGHPALGPAAPGWQPKPRSLECRKKWSTLTRQTFVWNVWKGTENVKRSTKTMIIIVCWAEATKSVAYLTLDISHRLHQMVNYRLLPTSTYQVLPGLKYEVYMVGKEATRPRGLGKVWFHKSERQRTDTQRQMGPILLPRGRQICAHLTDT